MSAVYELSFNPMPDADLKTGLAIETQLCRDFFLDAAQGIGDGDFFLGMDAVWVRQYKPLLPSSSSSASATVPAKDSAVKAIRKGRLKKEISFSSLQNGLPRMPKRRSLTVVR